jgi:hypothetical protein
MIGLWDREPKPGSTLARLEAAYLSGIETFDRMQTRGREHAASGNSRQMASSKPSCRMQ